MSCGRDTKFAIFECPDSSHLISQEEGTHCDFQVSFNLLKIGQDATMPQHFPPFDI